jgi:hypothetical protein
MASFITGLVGTVDLSAGNAASLATSIQSAVIISPEVHRGLVLILCIATSVRVGQSITHTYRLRLALLTSYFCRTHVFVARHFLLWMPPLMTVVWKLLLPTILLLLRLVQTSCLRAQYESVTGHIFAH